ncbi:transcriptional repressor [Comamonas testosteroni]|uniref:Fur family transcriptional regulator n=1 Tax=Comamonas testosteroni TaxID=285 RepID=UPI00391A7559
MEKVDSPQADQQRRSSRQRDAVKNAIEYARQPLLPTEILALAQTTQPTLGIATVYRNLKILVESGEVQTVDLPGEPTRYESAHHGHHHHFHCSACRQVFDVPGCPPNLENFAPKGFKVARHELTLYGTCADCEKADRRR